MRRTSLGAVLGVLVLAAAGVAGCDSGDEGPDAQACGPAAVPSAGAQPSSGGVTVAEQGFTQVPPDLPRNAITSPRVSMGAVLQNTSDQVAYRTRVVFDPVDAAGRPVVSGPQTAYKLIEVPILLPGAKVAVGNTATTDEGSTAAKVTITATVTAWLPPGGPANGLGQITATVDAGLSERDDKGAATLGYASESPNCAALISRGVTFAWRDPAGEIVGGNVAPISVESVCRPGGTTEPVTTMTQPNTVPRTADLARTEVTALCDIAKRPAPADSGRPVN